MKCRLWVVLFEMEIMKRFVGLTKRKKVWLQTWRAGRAGSLRLYMRAGAQTSKAEGWELLLCRVDNASERAR